MEHGQIIPPIFPRAETEQLGHLAVGAILRPGTGTGVTAGAAAQTLTAGTLPGLLAVRGTHSHLCVDSVDT